ncbi:hypothetical protein C8Q80DRAFT_1269169 [Daedaleopsis nitida]|nr:hypothetical protein C8Q80DRAFT_1269169 [Daedaleopsis nitida]
MPVVSAAFADAFLLVYAVFSLAVAARLSTALLALTLRCTYCRFFPDTLPDAFTEVSTDASPDVSTDASHASILSATHVTDILPAIYMLFDGVRRFSAMVDGPMLARPMKKPLRAAPGLNNEVVRHKDIVREKAKKEERLQAQLAGYGSHTQQRYREMQVDSGMRESSEPAAPGYDFGTAVAVDASAQDLQTARLEMEVDEGPDGQDTEDFVHVLRDIMNHPCIYCYRDTRTWKQRLERTTHNWSSLYEALTEAYLGWSYPGNLGDEPTPGDQTSPNGNAPRHEGDQSASPTPPMPGPEDMHSAPASPHHGPPSDSSCDAPPSTSGASRAASPQRDTRYDFTMDVIDMVTLDETHHFKRDASDLTPIALAKAGFLATSPLAPTLAISFPTLEMFRRLRRRKASYSIEAFAKVVCDMYGYPYRRRFRTAISDSYDVYLQILRNVDTQVKHAILHLEDEANLRFQRVLAMDGNNSLKRIAKIGDRNIADTREFVDSDYYLLSDYVDRYKDEVKNTRECAHARGEDIIEDDGDGTWSDEEGEPGEHKGEGPADFAGAADMLRECTKNWKSAVRDETKKMWGVFDETGIFAAACRHGFILWIIDMVRSGELAKYALAIVAKTLDVFEDAGMFGYDIGCTFEGTILNSSLGEEFSRRQCRCIVNAFHGYSHSHSCQTINHPTVVKGAGNNDLETMERVFSGSNELAPITRYASRYHRRVNIDIYFQQWDEDKYMNLGNTIYNFYRHAIDNINNNAYELQQWLAQTGRTLEDLGAWEKEEAAYFAQLGKVAEADRYAVEYVTRLREYWDLDNCIGTATSSFVTSIPEDYQPLAVKRWRADTQYRNAISRTQKQETQMRVLRERRTSALTEVVALETHMAYKVRTQIAKSLHSRSKAIRRAVDAYNRAAKGMVPPRATLDWTKVTHYNFLEEFELLRDTRNDLNGKPWADSLTRQYMKKARKIERSREEIERCNIEVCRLHTSVLEENVALDKAVASSKNDRHALAGAIEDFAKRRKCVNTRQMASISKIYALPGFSGNPTPGRRKGSSISILSSDASLVGTGVQLELQEMPGDNSEDEPEEEEIMQVTRVLEFATNLT